MSTLAEAVQYGQGVERPFRCEEHDDHQASASVNVLRGVWVCFACGAAGRLDSKKAPTVEELQVMLEPERACRVYPEAYLELFDNELGNFAGRFPRWLRKFLKLGGDPLTGDATFPVHTPGGRLAGVGRRRENPAEDQGRYAYPPHWSASRSLFTAGIQSDIVVLTEGAGDASGVAETGCFGAATYGAGLHQPQIELVMRLSPKLVILGFDADDAGQRAIYGATDKKGVWRPGAQSILETLVETAVVNWADAGGKDPNDLPVSARKELLAETVRGSVYRPDIEAEWTISATRMQSLEPVEEE